MCDAFCVAGFLSAYLLRSLSMMMLMATFNNRRCQTWNIRKGKAKKRHTRKNQTTDLSLCSVSYCHHKFSPVFLYVVVLCNLGQSEKPKSWKSKNGQADYLPRQSPDVRTVFFLNLDPTVRLAKLPDRVYRNTQFYNVKMARKSTKLKYGQNRSQKW